MLDSVKLRLQASGQLTPEVKRRIVEFESVCLSEIKSDALRGALIDYLENHCPLEFYTAPASSSGQRHPEWQSLPGGILLNTVECCIGADRKIRMYPSLTDKAGEPKDEPHDAVYAATVLSDTFKTTDFGKPWNDWSHHQKAASQWEKVCEKHDIRASTADRITLAIRWHLGRFTPDWPENKDPQTLDPVAFIVHELDMDFSNRRLSEIFQRRLGETSGKDPTEFLNKEFETASAYFQHVEGKLNNLLVFFATLLVAVITASYYLGSGDMFKTLTFSRTPRSFLMALLLIAFGAIGLVFIGVYTELRVRKIRMLEEMAAIRRYNIESALRNGVDIRPAIRMVSSIPECPPYLRRPSEDWYTLLLMTISSASSFAVALPFLTFGVSTALGVQLIEHSHAILVMEGLITWFGAGYAEFEWFTHFCYRLDVERQTKFAHGQYVFFSKHGQSFPWPLRWLDSVAGCIERRHSAAISKAANTSTAAKP